MYYKIYTKERMSETEYPVCVKGISVTLLDLLSGNSKLWKGMPKEIKNIKNNLLFKQAFKTAGDLFEVIPEDGKLDVVVEYNKEVREQLDKLKIGYLTISEEKTNYTQSSAIYGGNIRTVKAKTGRCNIIYLRWQTYGIESKLL